MKVKKGETVRVIHPDGQRCDATILNTHKNGLAVGLIGTAPRPYFVVSSKVTVELRDGVIIHATVWDNRNGLLSLRKLMTR